MLQREADIGACHGEPSHDIEAGGVFAARCAQELAARGNLREDLFDSHARSGRERGRLVRHHGAVIDNLAPRLFGIARPALQREARHAGDRGQRLAAKAQRGDLLDRPIPDEAFGQFRGRMAFERECHLVRPHPASVIAHFERAQPAFDQSDRYPRRTCVDRVLNQFLERRGGALDHLAGGDAIDERFGKAANSGHGGAGKLATKRHDFETRR